MHPTVSCYLAPARIADPCDQAQRDTPARAARRGGQVSLGALWPGRWLARQRVPRGNHDG